MFDGNKIGVDLKRLTLQLPASAAYIKLSTMTPFERSRVVIAFCEECVWLYSIRKHFADLFESGDRRQALLREVAETLFHDLNLVLLEYVLLQQCKLTDPASSGGDKENLTTNYIVELGWSADTARQLQVANAEIMAFRAKINDARRKLIAHLDLRTRLQPIDLGSFSSEEEERFWNALQTFVNAVHEEAIGGPYDIKVTMPDGDVASLIHCLSDAVDYSDLYSTDGAFLLGRFGQRRFDGV